MKIIYWIEVDNGAAGEWLEVFFDKSKGIESTKDNGRSHLEKRTAELPAKNVVELSDEELQTLRDMF